MIYKTNKAIMTVKVNHVIKRSDMNFYECSLMSQPKITIVCRSVKNEKFEDIEVGNAYNLTGYITDCKYTSILGNVFTTVLHFDKKEDYIEGNFFNEIDLVLIYKNKTKVHSTDKYKVCNLISEPITPNLTGRNIEISVWNSAISSLTKLKEGDKFHIRSFVRGFHEHDGQSNLKLSPFKVTII